MTIDILAALDQAFAQAESATNKDVAATACQHYATLAKLVQRQLLVAGMDSVTLSGTDEVTLILQSNPYPGRGLWPMPPASSTVATHVSAEAAGDVPFPEPDMTDSRNWKNGDVLIRSAVRPFSVFVKGEECIAVHVGDDHIKVTGSSGVPCAFYAHDGSERAGNLFTWLRHGEDQNGF